MIRAGFGLGKGFQTGAAASQAATEAMRTCGATSADLVVVFATADHFDDEHALMGPLAAATRARTIVGCSASGVVAGVEEIEHESAIAVLAVSGIEASSALEAEPAARSAEIGAALAAAAEGADALVVLADVLTFRPRALLAPLAGARTRIVGAAASGVGPGPNTWEIGADRVGARSISSARIKGTRVAVGVTHGARPIGSLFKVTRVEGNILFGLGDRTAVEAFQSVLPARLAEDPVRAANAMMVAVGDGATRAGHVTRSIVGIDVDKGAIALGMPIEEGATLRFAVRDPSGARQDMTAMLEELRLQLGDEKPAFGLYFNCSGRGEAFHGVAGLDSAYIQNAFGSFPLIGFFGGAEIGPCAQGTEVHLLTGVLALFR